MLRNGIAVDALRFFGEPLDEGCAIHDFAAGFGERLALLRGHDDGEVVKIGHHQVVPAAQDVSPLLAGLRTPGRPSPLGSLDRAPCFAASHIRNRADGLAARGVFDGYGFLAFGVGPGTIHVTLLTK
jgi:hypothetical protein